MTPPAQRAFSIAVTAAFVTVAMTFYFVIAHDGRDAMSTRLPLDDSVPLLPQAVWIYLSPYAVAPLLLARLEPSALWRALLRGVVVLVPLVLCFALVPTLVERPDLTALGDSPSVALLRLLYAVDDPPRNAAPSGHVSLVIVLAWGALQETRVWSARVAIGAYAGLVIVSTLLCGQHHIVDVTSGAALSLWALGAVSWLERTTAQRRLPAS